MARTSAYREQTIFNDLKGKPCNAGNGAEGSYRCTRPEGHEGDHWQAAVVASWSNRNEAKPLLTPQEKLDALEEMGFAPFFESHQPDCPNQWDGGLRCNCIPPGTFWRPPEDVKAHIHETREELRRLAEERTKERYGPLD